MKTPRYLWPRTGNASSARDCAWSTSHRTTARWRATTSRWRRRFRARLVALRKREIAQGVNVLARTATTWRSSLAPVNLATYGSRGQQRTVALALKLAELEYIEAETSDQPILLLDDVLSELDAQRRADLLDAVKDLDQVC